MKERLRKAMEKQERVKLIFEYPNSKKATIRRGKVIDVRDDAFEFKEDKDGLVTYSYKYLVEVKKTKMKYKTWKNLVHGTIFCLMIVAWLFVIIGIGAMK